MMNEHGRRKGRIRQTTTQSQREVEILRRARDHPSVRLAFIILSVALLFVQEAGAQAPLNTALKVRSLSAEQAKEELPVHLQATVHFIESPGTIFVQDDTAGTFFRTKSPLGDLREGDVVEVDGTTFPGLFLPGINTGHFRIVSHADLPKAQPASSDDLLSARYHYQHVSVEGIVRSVVTSDESHSVLRLAMGSRVLEVRVGAAAAEHESLVDARVRITGLAAGTINDLRQLVQPYLRIANWSSIVTLEPGRELNQVPQVTTASLLQFSASGETGHRVRVEGIVTAAFADGLVFIRDEEASMAVQLDQTHEVSIGQRIIVSGFPIMDRFTPTLADATLLEATTDEAPVPLIVTRKELLKHGHDGDLITLRGTITDLYRGTDGQTLKLTADDGQSLTASLRNGDALSVDLGSEVQLTGIARVESVSGKGFNASLRPSVSGCARPKICALSELRQDSPLSACSPRSDCSRSSCSRPRFGSCSCVAKSAPCASASATRQRWRSANASRASSTIPWSRS